MAEKYTKPFESVQDAISLFEQRIVPNKNSSSSNKEEKGEFFKDSTNCRQQLEAKECDKDLPVYEFDGPHKSPEELLIWLRLYKAETENYKEKFRKAQELFFEFEKGDESRTDAQNEDEILENELLKEMIINEYLHMELKQSKEAQAISEKSSLSAMKELEAEKMKLTKSERENDVLWIEEEGKRIQELSRPIQKMQEETSQCKETELELQAKISSRTSELRDSDEKSEIDVAKQEKSAINDEGPTSNKMSAFTDADSNGFCTGIVISVEEYDFLIRRSAMADNLKSVPDDGSEIDELKRELEDKNAEVRELTCRYETTLTRAEMAEKAKIDLEDQLRKWREQRQLRRAASEALKEYAAKNPEDRRQHKEPLHKRAFNKLGTHGGVPSIPKRTVSMHDGRQSKYIPLGKFLKIKF